MWNLLKKFTKALASIILLSACSTTTKSINLKDEKSPTEKPQKLHSQSVQVVGLIWLNPLHRKDYPTEWQLMWTLGLVQPNRNDDMVKKNSSKFSRLQSIGPIIKGRNQETPLQIYHKLYLNEFTMLLHGNYFSNPNYFYNVHNPDNRKLWRELAGIRIEHTLPENLDPRFTAKQMQIFFTTTFDIGNKEEPVLSTRDTPPDVNVTSGGASAGFTSLTAAMDYLKDNPDKTAWAMSWDAPSRPLEAQMNENLVVLVLAGPTYNTGRKALAWLARPADSEVTQMPAGDLPRTVQAWQATIAAASANASIAPRDIGYVIHDAHNTHPQSSARIAPLAQTLTMNVPDLDFIKQTFNTSALLGDMGAASALTNIALGIGYANHFGRHVLVAGTTEPGRTVAVVVSPPEEVRPIDHEQPWFRARTMNNVFLPWWGLRHDAKRRMQGYSD